MFVASSAGLGGAGLAVVVVCFVGLAALVGVLVTRVGQPPVDPAQGLDFLPPPASPAPVARTHAGATDATSEGLRSFAADLGFTYEAVGGPAPLPHVAGSGASPLLAKLGIRGLRMADVVSGVEGGREVLVFRYDTASFGVTFSRLPDGREGAARGASLIEDAVMVAVRTPEPLPFLEVHLRGGDARGIEAFVGEVEVESEDFNRTFAVMAQSRKLVYDALPPRSLERMLQDPFPFATSGDLLLATLAGRFDATRVAACLDTMVAIVDYVPEFVWDELARWPVDGSPGHAR